jgi:hypothetical protein
VHEFFASLGLALKVECVVVPSFPIPLGASQLPLVFTLWDHPPVTVFTFSVRVLLKFSNSECHLMMFGSTYCDMLLTSSESSGASSSEVSLRAEAHNGSFSSSASSRRISTATATATAFWWSSVVGL